MYYAHFSTVHAKMDASSVFIVRSAQVLLHRIRVNDGGAVHLGTDTANKKYQYIRVEK